MRNLENQIAEWRRTIAKASGHRAELLDELEEHLREDIARLLHSGVSEDVAFQTAVSKLGTPSAIAAEYDKLIPNRTVWWPVTIARICTVAAVFLVGAMLLRRIDKAGVLLVSHVWCATLGYLMMFAIGGLSICYICGRWFDGPGPTQRDSLLRSTFQFAHIGAILTGLGVILGMLWAKAHWGRYWAWDPKETGAFLVIVSAVLIGALRWRKATQNTVMVLGVLGSAVTAWAWFGTRGGFLSPFLIAFLALHVGFLASLPAMSLAKRHTARN